MKKLTRNITITLLALTFTLMAFSPLNRVYAVPVTGNEVLDQSPALVNASTVSLSDFTASVKNGNSGQIVGLYAKDVFALKVVQQPSGNPGFVSASSSSVVTQFGLTSSYGSIGMLAHNFLAGAYFYNLSSGNEILVVYGDGTTETYTVSSVRKYQALSPNSVNSNFIDLSDPRKTLSSTDVFEATYGNDGALVLQTCISANGNSSWGRLFVIAYK